MAKKKNTSFLIPVGDADAEGVLVCSAAFPISLEREFTYKIPPALADKISIGSLVKVPFGKRTAEAVITSVVRAKDNPLFKEIAEIISAANPFGKELMPLADFISHRWLTSRGAVLHTLSPQTGQAAENGKNELLKIPPNKFADGIPLDGCKETLLMGTDADDCVISAGVRVLNEGKQVLIIFADILSAQRFSGKAEKHIPKEKLLFLHSGLPQKSRAETGGKAAGGFPAVFFGARSVCLTPLKNPGLIAVINEEHPALHQEESSPRYHAREVAKFRAKFHNCPLLLSSPAPSMETFNAHLAGSIEIIKIPNPFDYEIITAGKPGGISEELISSLRKTLCEQKKAVLVLNRKGFETYACLNCGYQVICEKCKSKVIEENGQIFCEKCNVYGAPPAECPKCKNRIFKTVKSGIKKIESELKKLFPLTKMQTLSAGVKRAAADKTADIFLGTRFSVSNPGLDNIGLVALLDADEEFLATDFRADERAFQALADCARLITTARAEIIIQTNKPENPVFNFFKEGAYGSFAVGELTKRKELSYPPFTNMARLLIMGKEAKKISKFAKSLVDKLEKFAQEAGKSAPADYEIFEPVPCRTDMRKKLQRTHIVIKCADEEFILRLCRKSRTVKPPAGISLKTAAFPTDFR